MWVQSLGGEDSLDNKWQPTSVILQGESQGKRSLAGYCPWGCKRVRYDLVTNQQPSTPTPDKDVVNKQTENIDQEN